VPDESRNTLELRVTRRIDGGLREEIALTNYTMERTSFVFTIEIETDFADQAETRERRQHGELTRRGLRFDYTARHEGAVLHRGVELDVDRAWTYDGGKLSFEVSLAPKERCQHSRESRPSP
jgi:hypothetical protein